MSEDIYGLRVWNAQGKLRLDTTKRLARFNSYHTGTLVGGGLASPNHTDVSVPGIVNDGTWQVMLEGEMNGAAAFFTYEIRSGNKVRIRSYIGSSYLGVSFTQRWYLTTFRI